MPSVSILGEANGQRSKMRLSEGRAKWSMVNGQCSMVIMPSVSILGEANVLKCHIHKTFLHITLHENTKKTPKNRHLSRISMQILHTSPHFNI